MPAAAAAFEKVTEVSLLAVELRSAGSFSTSPRRIKISKTTVFDDGFANTLTGGAGQDWFFRGKKDVITDLAGNERIE
jgi:hypothetical protein